MAHRRTRISWKPGAPYGILMESVFETPEFCAINFEYWDERSAFCSNGMRIVIDGTSLLLPGAGVRTYMHYWLLSLSEDSVKRHDRLSVYPLGVPLSPSIDHERSVSGRLTTKFRLALVPFLNIRWNPAIEMALIGADVFHCSQHTVNLPRFRRVTATVFDLSCWTTPENHTEANITATRRYAERILKVADGLIAISEHARNDAIDILRIPGERIRVIYPGVAEPFFQVTAEQIHQSRQKLHLDSPYMLFVGCIEPRKNISNIVSAYLQLPESLRKDVRLIIAGPFGWEREEVREMLLHSGDGIRYLGYVPEADLPGLVGGAVALVYPSFYEGFGLPAAQAMAAGIPVIGSDRSCIPEVVGGGGILVNPHAVEALRDAMERICTSTELCQTLGRRGRARALQFRWSTCGAQSLQFFHDVNPVAR